LLAKKYDLPVIIHNRESKDDVLEILKETDCTNFIFHCYSENLEYAEKLLKFSSECKISFSGILTFNSAQDVQDTAKNIPMKHILAETDAPYLTPTPYR
jgi:TatD DNase family protein